MLDELQVSNVALIRDASLELSGGLTVLTGETGAGKTALLSALKLAVGERADAGAVRDGAQALEVIARFYLPEDSDGTVVRRRVSADGRGRVEIDGSMASVRELQERVGATVDLCGQHEHQRLLSASTHGKLLDAWAGEPARVAKARWDAALAARASAAAEVARLEELGRTASARLEEAEYTLRRIDEVAPQEGELERLEEELPRIAHAEALLMAAEGARAAIAGGEGGETSAYDLVVSAVDALYSAASYDRALKGYAETLETCLVELEDTAASLASYRESVEFDPAALNEMQKRISQLRGLMRAFGPTMPDVFARRARALALLEEVGDGGARLAAAHRALAHAEAELDAAAEEFDGVRADAAPRLAAAVTAQMGRLEMGSASVEAEVTRLPRAQWGPSGPSHVELLYRPARGVTARPLRKIASGGEISRVTLAAKVALGGADTTETLVFDEVDAGVGGATAVALAAVLADLAKTRQVIVVTHLAQVAVQASRHYVVSKRDVDGGVETTLSEVTDEERVAEVARMLSGDAGETSLAHAREMLGA